MVSSWRMTPLMYCSRPAAVNSVCRYARRFSSVHSTFTLSKRFLHVTALSSAARMPFPPATIAFAVAFSISWSIDIFCSLVTVNRSLSINMACTDISDRTGIRGHHDGMCVRILCTDRDPFYKGARHDAGGGKADVVAACAVGGAEN